MADFACQSAKLVVEVDGDTHGVAAAVAVDAQRTAFLAQEGYRTVRFGNADVMGNLDGVAATILAALPPSPFYPAMPGGALTLPHAESRA
ncbi:DUF559 domain-containing protein [Sphingomonadaceae bacterium OTU29THOMA1]|uniref:endonuclease domain-containing protein n=1 Tax=Sphingomonas sp. Leaf37 TaxID=2876552 RepID=UPI001E620603|nr:DUF559 domain-containing protein [Sphingomonas sp. Leaf37]USU14039.1 DUF559 domain-containing protein [Sphingomonadaceae bacterium OTU29THOMA1]